MRARHLPASPIYPKIRFAFTDHPITVWAGAIDFAMHPSINDGGRMPQWCVQENHGEIEDVFESLDQVREISAEWLQRYNEERPHDGLAGLPRATYRAQFEARNSLLEVSP